MLNSDLGIVHTVSPRIASSISGRGFADAISLASQNAATALNDLAIAKMAAGEFVAGVQLLQETVNRFPECQHAFHNLAAALLARGELKGRNLQSLVNFVMRYRSEIPWVSQYRRLIYMPAFLNLAFVEGKCNLHCRMCVGRNSSHYPNRLSYMTAETLDRILTAVPTVGGITLSSGSSDPLLHPELEKVTAVAARHQITLDLYTNGHAMNERQCEALVLSKAVQMINVSIDAATPETYKSIRGAALGRVLANVDRLQQLKVKAGLTLPWVSFSFVAMADNISELPDFVRLALRHDAHRVYVEDVIGASLHFGGNRRPTDHPACGDYVREAMRLANDAQIALTLPPALRDAATAKTADDTSRSICDASPSVDGPTASAAGASGPATKAQCCCWLRGVWVRMDGRLDPCCVVCNVADMGNINDGPLIHNEKYMRVKDLLMSGKVFTQCLSSPCEYVRQRLAAGSSPPLITSDDLGELRPDSLGAPTVSAENTVLHESAEPLTATA